MVKERITVTLDSEVGDAVRAAAEDAGLSVSAWVAHAAAERIRQQNLRRFLDEYEAEHGAFTDEELAEADKFFRDAKALAIDPSAPHQAG